MTPQPQTTKHSAIKIPALRLNVYNKTPLGSEQRANSNNFHQSRLAAITPGKTIDQLKSNITRTLKDTVRLRNEIGTLEEFVNGRRDICNELAFKTTEALAHKDELFRDCSTFELNLTKGADGAIFCEVDDMKDKIQDTMVQLGATL